MSLKERIQKAHQILHEAENPPVQKGDVLRCVIMGRDKASQEWELIVLTEKKSVAWRSAASMEEQEHRLGNTRFQAVVLSEADFDAGRFKCRLKPPPGFDYELPEVVTLKKAFAATAALPVKGTPVKLSVTPAPGRPVKRILEKVCV